MTPSIHSAFVAHVTNLFLLPPLTPRVAFKKWYLYLLNFKVTMATKDTLFLDRDGVINVQLTNDYVKNTSELVLREDFLKALPLLTQKVES